MVKNELQNHSIISASLTIGSAEINVVKSDFLGVVCVLMNIALYVCGKAKRFGEAISRSMLRGNVH